MDRKKMVMQRLRELDALRQAVGNLPLELRALEDNSRRRELKDALRRARCGVKSAEQALQVLTPEERLVVDRLFIYPQKGNVQRLCQELYIEQSSVYRRRDRALSKLAAAMFGKTAPDRDLTGVI